MKLEINITKEKFWVITTLLVLAIGVFVFAATETKPNPGHSADEVEGTVPSGFCLFSAEKNSCPNGFVKSEKFNDATIRGMSNSVGVGSIGGVASYITNGNDWGTGSGGANALKLINNDGKEANNPFDNWPPYVGVLICCKE